MKKPMAGRQRKFFFSDGGAKIAVEIDAGSIVCCRQTSRQFYSDLWLLNQIQDEEVIQQREKLALHARQRAACKRKFRVAVPISGLFFIASFGSLAAQTGTSFNPVSCLLAILFVSSIVATVALYIGSGAMGESARLTHYIVEKQVSAKYGAQRELPSQRYYSYLYRAAQRSSPLMSPKLFAIFSAGGTQFQGQAEIAARSPFPR